MYKANKKGDRERHIALIDLLISHLVTSSWSMSLNLESPASLSRVRVTGGVSVGYNCLFLGAKRRQAPTLEWSLGRKPGAGQPALLVVHFSAALADDQSPK